MSTATILSQFKNLNMLVIGDMMLDHYIWGDVNRISPEAPVPVLHVTKETYTAGGAANVAINAASLGIRTSLIGVIGDDEQGKTLLGVLQCKGVNTSACVTSTKVATIIKTRAMARNQQLCRIDRESVAPLYDLLTMEDLQDAVAATDVIILSDYAKGAISQRLVDDLLAYAAEHKIKICMDPKPSRQLQFRNVGLMTPNRHEALLLANIPEPSHAEPYPIEAVCAAIDQKFSPQLLVVTLGADGMVVSTKGKIDCRLPAQAQEVFDVSGAGDTVIATLAAAIAIGASPRDAAQFANHAASIVVSKMGTATVTPEEMMKLPS